MKGLVRNPNYEYDDDVRESEEDYESYSHEEEPGARVTQMAYNAYRRADSLHQEISMEQDNDPLPAQKDLEDTDDAIDFEKMMQECTDPVYKGSRETRMQSGIVLMTLSTVYGVFDTFLSALASTLLPLNNSLPRTAYELKNMIRRLGLDHERIDLCPDRHVLYEGDVHGNLQKCPQCQHPRYVRGSSSMPHSITRYFPLTTKLKRLYRCPKIAGLLNHFEGMPAGGNIMRSVVDSLQWKEVSRLYPEFENLGSNLRLGLVANEVCPHRNQSSKHSIWIILIVIYSFLPWLCTKKFFLNLSLLISGLKAPTCGTIDVF